MKRRIRRIGTNEGEARDRARGFRDEHGLGVQPIGDLVTLIEQTTGFDVVVMEAGEDEHGLAMRDPRRGAIFIAVAKTQKPMRQRSSLAHELAHVLFEDFRTGQAATPGWMETRADAFARHLLVPEEGLPLVVEPGRPVTMATVSDVVQRFLVSPAIAAIALAQAGYITEELKDEWRTSLSAPRLASRFGWRDQYIALAQESDRARAPQKLLQKAIEGYVAGVVSAQSVANVRGVDVETLLAELEDAGVEVEPPPDTVWADPGDLSSSSEISLDELDGLLGPDEPARGPDAS